jgi:hypothetical protein
MNSVKIVEEFWERVWKARNPAAIDDFVIEDFVITTGGVDVVSRTKFKEWAAAFCYASEAAPPSPRRRPRNARRKDSWLVLAACAPARQAMSGCSAFPLPVC